MSLALQRSYPRGKAAPLPQGRRWRLSPDGLAAAGDAERDVVAVPSEQILLTVLDLPLPTHRRRLEALPFAMEERLADPLDALHIALGEEVEPGRYLAAAVSHAAMRGWLVQLEDAGLASAALVPDALLITRPPTGAWSARVEGLRALVRTDDGAGFALRADQFAAAWSAGGQPPVQVLEGTLPGTVPAVADVPVGAMVAAIPLDLRQGAYAPRRAGMGLVRRAGWIAAAGLAAHGAIAAADTAVLRSMAQQSEAEVRVLVAQVTPLAEDGDVVSVATERLAGIAPAAAPDRLLPLAARVAAALRPAGLAARGLTFDGSAIIIEVAPEDGRRVAAAVSSAGMAAVARGGRVRVTEGGA